MKAIKDIVLLLALLTSLSFGSSYRILGVFPFNAKSHDSMISAVVKGLANRGHQVDVITQFPMKNPPENYKVLVNLDGTLEQLVNSFTVKFARSIYGNPTAFIATKYGNQLCDLMGLESIQKIIKNPPADPPYDVVITHAFGANCYMGFGHVFNVPVVTISTSSEMPWMSDFIGNDDNLATVPIMFFESFDRKNFWHRLQNLFMYYWNVNLFHRLTEDYQTQAMRKYLDPNISSIREVEKSVALTLVNRHPVIFGARPVNPSLVEVSGLHVDPTPPKLSAELQQWLDESTDGVVYFTFGSMVMIETLSRNIILDIYKSFRRLAPMRIVMKVVDKTKLPPGLPKNIFTSSWIPQQAVLNHKNVRVFITHGGLMGCQEALYYGVPLIGIPLFTDQMRNIKMFVDRNMAVFIDFNNLTNAAINEALDKVLNDPKYRESAKHYAKLFKDLPQSAMDTAMFWIEYVIRNGPELLRAPALDLTWWQLRMLDVYGFVLLCIVCAVITIWYLIKLILLKLFSSKSQKKAKKQ